MAEDTIIQNLIGRLGQSQDDRLPAELDAHFVEVDERTQEDLLQFAEAFAALVQYKATDGTTGDWTPFFELAGGAELSSILTQTDGEVPPHLALLATFLELYEVPRTTINTVTDRHLDFFYEKVLGFVAAGPSADKAHVLVELKKGASSVAVTTDHVFSAGKDEAGVELLYVPTHETVVGTATVESLCSIFVDDTDGSIVRFSPVANSSDGLGGDLEEDEAKWPAFGTTSRPAADIGFAIASPVLQAAGGDRTITLTLTVDGLDAGSLTAETLAAAFTTYVTGEEGWLGPYSPTAAVSGDELTLTVLVEDDAAAIIDYDVAIHGHAFAAGAPIIQVLFVAGAGLGYDEVKGLTISKAQLAVSVAGLRSLTLENDTGTLDPKKAFLPWGSQPLEGSRFMIGSAEMLSKQLSSVTIDIDWHGAPDDFETHYDGYGNDRVDNDYFTASASLVDGVGRTLSDVKMPLFANLGSTATGTLTLTNSGSRTSKSTAGAKVQALVNAGSRWSTNESIRKGLEKPTSKAGAKTGSRKGSSAGAAPDARRDFIVVSLDKSFLHAEFRKKSIEKVLEAVANDDPAPTILNEPYTPAIRSLSLSYVATAQAADLESADADAFAETDIQFFHVGCFGQMREHAYQRSQFDFVTGDRVPLLPQYDDSGELCIGLSGLEPGGSASLLFQVADGSADPDIAAPEVEWSVLCDNYWKPLETGEVTRDTTSSLLASGTITFVIPSDATTTNTIMPSGYVWLRGAVERDADGASQLIDVQANAVEVALKDVTASPAHLSAALPAESIAKLKTPIATVKAVTQPYASFDGAPEETASALRTRAAERLRHRNRSVTAWDYERMVLSAFPKVHRAKCIPHAKPDNWLAPGNVLLVVVPDLRNQNAVDPLAPKVDAATISDITEFLTAHTGMGVRLTVSNPRYQRVRLDLKVKFHDGYEFNYYSEKVQEALIQFLSPWAFAADRSMSFGGKVYKSVLLDVVEELSYVDYVTEVKLYSSSVDGAMGTVDEDEVQAETPDAILVSDASHSIAEAD